MRWLNQDPIGENGGLNTFAFTDNDSVNGVDVMGLVSLEFVTSVPGSSKNLSGQLIDGYKHVLTPDDVYVHDVAGRGGEAKMNLVFSDGVDPASMTTEEFLDGSHKPDCVARVVFYIRVDPLQKEYSGKKYYYREHIMGNDGPQGRGFGNGPRDATLAHEKGHVRAYLEIVRPCLEQYFQKFAGHGSRAFTEQEKQEIRNQHKACQTQTYWKLSAQYANDAHRAYFDTNPNYVRLHPKALGIIPAPPLGTPITVELDGRLMTVTDIWRRK
jgi:hypothetical protein